MSSTTAIQLTELPALGTASAPEQRRPDRPAPAAAAAADEVLQASQAADSSVPDGGYGWVIVASGAVLLWWSVGIVYTWGVMQAAIADEGVATPAVLSFVGSIQAAMVSVLAIANSRLMRALGARSVALLGTAFIGGGEILSGFTAGNIGGLFFTSGLLVGIGISLAFFVTAAVPAQYFTKRRGLATGLMFAGSGFGGAANSFMVDALLKSLGPAWTFRVVGLTTIVTCAPAAWLLKERAPVSRRGLVEWRLFKSLSFDLVFVGSALGTFPLFVPPFFIPLYVKSMGSSSNVAASLVAGFNLASAVGRILSGVACDKLGSLNTLVITLASTSITMLAIWPASTTLGPLVLFIIVNGAANGAFFSTMPTVVSNVFGSARVSIAMSMVLTGWLGGYLMGAPIAGYLLEAFGGADGGLRAFRPAMFYAGSLALVATALIATARFRASRSLLAKC